MNQMQKTLASLGALLLVAGGVGLFAWKGVYETDEKNAAKKAAEERLISAQVTPQQKDAGVAKLDFTHLVVTTKGETTELTRADGQPWKIVAPVQARVDPLVIDALVSQLQTARFKTTLDGEATDAELKTYGLDVPAFSVEAEAVIDGQPKKTKLEGGIENPFDGTVYMRKDGSRTVHMAEGGVRWSLAKTTFDLREKEIFAVDDAKLEKLTMKSAANDWELVRGDDKAWRFTRPEALLADPTGVNAMLGAIQGERAIAFPTAAPEALGFSTPLVTATFSLSTGPVTVKLARPNPDAGDVLYALRDDADGRVLAQVNGTARGAFDRTTYELRDKSVLPFVKQTVTRIVFSSPGAPDVVVERESADASLEAWRLTAPTQGPARGYKIATTLWLLGAVKAGAVTVDKPDAKVLEAHGVDAKHARSVTLFSGSTELGRLFVGKELIGKPGTSYAVGPRKAIVEIDTSKFGDLPWRPEELLDVPAPSDAGTP